MGPSWGKMGSGSELDGIFERLRRKMEVNFDVRRKMIKNFEKTHILKPKVGKSLRQEFGAEAGTGAS